MTDVLTKEQRRYNMSRIKGKNTKVELKFRKHLQKLGLKGYQLHSNSVFGRPDVTFDKFKVAVFIDGCLWHKCKIHYVPPKTRKYFWINKIEANVTRDKLVNKTLKKTGWKVLRFWEHEVHKNMDYVMNKIREALNKA